LSLDRISDGRFVLGLGSGDRPEEFAAFGEDLEGRAATFRERWTLLRAALSPEADARTAVLQATGGFDVLPAPATRIPMLVVGTARQSLQWIAREAEGWATYHREEAAQEGASACGSRRWCSAVGRASHSCSRCFWICRQIRRRQPSRCRWA
jgi:alkanesulfonate monooxygenase SsuD/methylene tetrahydromethanopterin reductase-like flavin-dependent oxidoreductase (luciferase family)